MAVRFVTVQYNVDTTQLEQSRDIIRQIANELDMTEEQIDGVNSELQEQTGILGRLRQEEQRLLRLREQTNDPNEVRQYNRELERTRGEMRNLTGETQRSGNAFKSFGKLVAGALAVSTIKNFIGGAIELGAQMETLEIQFEQFAGSAEGAKQILGDIEQFAASTPFQFETLATAGRNMLAFGFATEDVLPNLRKLGDIAAGSGNDIGELSELFGKARVQGRLFAEDINQFLGRGIPIVKGLAEAMGVTEKEVKKLVENGEVGFEQLEGAIEALAGETGQYFGLTEKLADSTAGKLSTLKDNWDSIRRTIGEALLPVLNEAVGAINNILTGHKETQKELNNFLQKERISFIVNKYRDSIERLAESTGATREELFEFTQTLEGFENSFNVKTTKSQIPILEELSRRYIQWKNAQLEADEATTKTTQSIEKQSKATEKAAQNLGKYTVNLDELIEKEQEVVEKVFDPASGAAEIDLPALQGNLQSAIALYDELFTFVEQEGNQTGQEIVNLLQEGFENIGPALAQGFEIASNIQEAFFSRQESELEQQKQRELKLYGNTEEAKIAINERFAKKEEELRRKQAQQAKRLAIFETIINTAAAIVKALPNIPLSLLAAATGASQLAVIQAQSFAKGVIGLGGPGTETSDSIPAWLSRGESVMTARETRNFRPTLEAIRGKQIDPMLLNDFVRGKISISGGSQGSNIDVLNALGGIRKELKGLQIQTLVLDENGFSRFISSRDTYKYHLNKIYG